MVWRIKVEDGCRAFLAPLPDTTNHLISGDRKSRSHTISWRTEARKVGHGEESEIVQTPFFGRKRGGPPPPTFSRGGFVVNVVGALRSRGGSIQELRVLKTAE